MNVKVTFECDGCPAKSGPHTIPHRVFTSVSGRSWGFGTWSEPTSKDVLPDGWVDPDPLTGCTYCPTCWAEIVSTAAPCPQGDQP